MEFNVHIAALEGCFHYFNSQKSSPQALLLVKKVIRRQLELMHNSSTLLSKLEIHELFFVLLSHCKDLQDNLEYLEGVESVTNLFPNFSLETFISIVRDCSLSFCLEECLTALDIGVSLSIIERVLGQFKVNAVAQMWPLIDHLFLGYLGVLCKFIDIDEIDGKASTLMEKLCDEFITLITNCKPSNAMLGGKMLSTELSSLPYITDFILQAHEEGKKLKSAADYYSRFDVLMKHAWMSLSNISMLTMLDWNELETDAGVTLSCSILGLLQKCRDQILKISCLSWFNDLSIGVTLKKMLAVMESVLSIQVNDLPNIDTMAELKALLYSDKLNELDLQKAYQNLHTVQLGECQQLLQWVVDSDLLLKSPHVAEFILVLVSSFGLDDQLYLYKTFLSMHCDSGLFQLKDFSMITCSMNQWNPENNAHSWVMFLWFYMQNPYETLIKFMTVMKNSKLQSSLQPFLAKVGDLFCGVPKMENPLICLVILHYLQHSDLSDDEKSSVVEFSNLLHSMNIIDSEEMFVGIVNPLLEEQDECLILTGLKIWKKSISCTDRDSTGKISCLLRLLDRALKHCNVRLKTAVLSRIRDLVSLESLTIELNLLLELCTKLHPSVRTYLDHMKMGDSELCYCHGLVQKIKKLCSESSFASELHLILSAKVLMCSTELEFESLLTAFSQLNGRAKWIWMSHVLPGLCRSWMVDPNVVKRCLEQYCVIFKKAYDEDSLHFDPENNLECLQRWIFCHNLFNQLECLTSIILMFIMCIQKNIEFLSDLQIQKYVSLLLLIEDPTLKTACYSQMSLKL